jgi:hypothetical protein
MVGTAAHGRLYGSRLLWIISSTLLPCPGRFVRKFNRLSFGICKLQSRRLLSRRRSSVLAFRLLEGSFPPRLDGLQILLLVSSVSTYLLRGRSVQRCRVPRFCAVDTLVLRLFLLLLDTATWHSKNRFELGVTRYYNALLSFVQAIRDVRKRMNEGGGGSTVQLSSSTTLKCRLCCRPLTNGSRWEGIYTHIFYNNS